MSISPITTPLGGEQVVDLWPADMAAATVTWMRRPNLFAGRALTAPTLEARSEWATGQVVLRGQAFTPGVVDGLETGYTVTPAGDSGRPTVRLQVAAGRGLAASGEDLRIPRGVEVDFYGLPVVAPPGVFDGDNLNAATPGTLLPRAIGPALGDLLTNHPGVLPPAGVLVLQPAAVDVAAIDPNDPCDRCGCAEGNVSYEDWRLADCVRLLWYAWPVDWAAVPTAGPGFRNALAYAVFDAEAADPAATLPWEEFGVPIALIGTDHAYVPAFSDRAAVVRSGGRGRDSRLCLGSDGPLLDLVASPRLAPLWQARIEQLAGQIADLGDTAPDAANLARSFARLPPCGLLPTNVLDLNTLRSGFFPAGFDLDAVPVPLEQLDLAVHDAAPLAPFDFSLGERLRVMVPVSQASWEPRLLLTETLDPLFRRTLDDYLLDRSRALGARQGLRAAEAALRQAIDATPPATPAPGDDPLALEAESYTPWGPPPAGGGHRAAVASGRHQHFFEGATATLTPGTGESLYAWVCLDPDHPSRTLMLQWHAGDWEHRAYWGENLIELGADGTVSRYRAGDLPTAGEWLRLEVPAAAVGVAGQAIDGMSFTLYDGRAAYGATGRLAAGNETPWFARTLPAGAVEQGDYAWDFLTPNALWAPFEPAFGLVMPPPGNAAPPDAGVSGAIQDLLTGGALATLSNHERGQLTARGLTGFITYLSDRTDRADDVVDYGFLKVQTDIYRIRQLVLGSSDATRLAVSPTLAGIAQSETAVASQQQISTFFDALKGAQATTSRTRSSATSGGGSSSGGAGIRSPASSGTGGTTGPALSALNIGADVRSISLGGTIGTVRTIDTGLKLTETTPADVRLDTGITPVITPPTGFTPIDIANANPLVGSATIRTMSIAQRLAEPKAKESRDYTGASRQDAVNRLLALADDLREEDSDTRGQPGETSGLFTDLAVIGVRHDPFLGDDESALAARRLPFAKFLDLTQRAALLSKLVLAPPHLDPDGNPIDADESLQFSDAADTSDTTVALLRQVEGRVRLYRDAIATCRQTLSRLQSDYRAAAAAERAWSDTLAEARHDVAVTRALMAEEQDRLDAVNARRKAVLASEVRFLAFARPRDADNLLASPARSIDPGLVEPAVPACRRSHPEIADQLADMLVVLRDAPASWFDQGTTWLDELTRVDLLVKAVQTAQSRTRLAIAAPAATVSATTETGLAAAVASITAKHLEAVTRVRAGALRIDPVRLGALTWQGAFQQAVQVVSLGDLMAGSHGTGASTRRAAAFYNGFAEVCACLHAELSGVLPAIRLDWATTLSELDSAPNLRNLANLPRWSEIAYGDRQRMQGLADWLFSQASATEARAQSLVNDIVRMCLLLASDAPVDRIIAGRIPRPVTARPGLRIPLLPLQAGGLRVGMQAVVYQASKLVVRAVVEDVGGAEASARVLQTSQDSVDLDTTARVQFADSAGITFATTPLRLSA